MGVAEVWLEIQKIVPYVAVAGFAGGAALAAYRRDGPVAEAGHVDSRLLDDAAGGSGTTGRTRGRGSRLLRALVQRLPSKAVFFSRAGVGWTLGALLLLVVVGVSGWWTAQSQRKAAPLPSAAVAVEPARPVATSDGGLKFGSLAGHGTADAAEANDPADTAWLFGALVSGGRSSDAWALLTPEAQRGTSVDNFAALLGSAYLLRGSDDAPWRVPGSDTFLFSVSDRSKPAALKGELRVALALVDGEWRVSDFKLRAPAQPAPRPPG